MPERPGQRRHYRRPHAGGLENLSLTERRYLESLIMSDGNKIRHQPDGSFYTGFCFHPLSITGIGDHFRERSAYPAD